MIEGKLGQRALVRGWGFIMSTLEWNFFVPEFSWSGSIHYLGQAKLITSHSLQKAGLLPLTLALCRQLERRQWSRLFLPCYRPLLPLLLLPLSLWNSATPSCFCGSFIYRVVLPWDHVLFILGWYDRRSSPRPFYRDKIDMKHYIPFKGMTWWLDICIYCKMITTINLVNIHHHS